MLYCLKHQWAANPKMSMKLEIIDRATELIHELSTDVHKAKLDSGLSLPRFTIVSSLIHTRTTKAGTSGSSRSTGEWDLGSPEAVQQRTRSTRFLTLRPNELRHGESSGTSRASSTCWCCGSGSQPTGGLYRTAPTSYPPLSWPFSSLSPCTTAGAVMRLSRCVSATEELGRADRLFRPPSDQISMKVQQ